MAYSAEERARLRQQQQRQTYATSQIEQQAAIDSTHTAAEVKGFDCERQGAIAQRDGGTIVLPVTTNGAVAVGTSVISNFNAIDGRPRVQPQTTSSRTRSPLVAAFLFQAETFAHPSIELPKSRYYLRLAGRTIDLGEFDGSLNPSALWMTNLSAISRPQSAIIVQLLTSFDLTRTIREKLLYDEREFSPLMLRSWVVDPSGRILAESHLLLRDRHINSPFESAPSYVSLPYADRAIEYPAAFDRFAQHLMQPEAVTNLDPRWPTLYRLNLPQSWNPRIPNEGFTNPAIANAANISRLQVKVGDATVMPSIASLYSAQAIIQRTPIASAADLYSATWTQSRTLPPARSLFADFPILSEWGMTAQSFIDGTAFSVNLSVEQILASSPQVNPYAYGLREWIFTNDDANPNNLRPALPVRRRFRLLGGAAIA